MKNVLVIEDDDNNMVLITALLEKYGYRVSQARNGVDGVSKVEKESPDFIILDIQLPDIDGFEVLQRIRTGSSNGNIPIIAMTSYAMSGDRERMLKMGCNGYIEKPIDPIHVIDQIKEIIGES